MHAHLLRASRLAKRLPSWTRSLWANGLPSRLRALSPTTNPKTILSTLLLLTKSPEHTLSKAIRLHALAIPSHTAISHADTDLSYQHLNNQCDLLASALSAANVQPRDTIAVILPNSPLFLISAIASSRINANFLPIGTQYKHTETSYILRHAKPKILIISSDYIDNLDPAIAEEGTQIWIKNTKNQTFIPFHHTDVDAALSSAPLLPLSKLIKNSLNVEQNDANQLIMYTSGTTGKPKGATRNISDLGVEGILNLATALNIHFDEKLYICTPLYHAAPGRWPRLCSASAAS